uniref:Zmp:0000000624 n=1 Tax=Gasterosteus aculeatus aculeatus TaxID=481459 RepID=G3P2N0_GASAC
MTKDNSSINPSKRKKQTSNVTVHAEETTDTKVKKKKKLHAEETTDTKVTKKKKLHAEETTDTKVKKKKKLHVEEAPEQIPDVTIETSERKRKKKKKAKQSEKRVLERKMKKILKKEEKKRLKAAGETEPKAEAPGPIAGQQALDYLTCWAENRAEWRFQKTRQTWLLQHCFDFEQISDEKFSVLLQYLEGLCGGSKDITVQKALALVEESGQAPEDKDVQQRARRARQVIQLLS